MREDGPIIYVSGEGLELKDAGGDTLLEMMGSHTRANSLGYGNREIAQAVFDQMCRWQVSFRGTSATSCSPPAPDPILHSTLAAASWSRNPAASPYPS